MDAPRVVVVGGGHNGLVCAAYLARAGARVTLLERRDRLGGACVTEELWPGYHVSRAAYVVSLLRPAIVKELALERHGLRLLPRRPASFTPLPDGRSLTLGADPTQNRTQIAQFSHRDAEAFPGYEAFLERIAGAFEGLLDVPPPELPVRRRADLRAWWRTLGAVSRLRRELPRVLQLMVGAARPLLMEWFESEPLRSTLATDAVIGAFAAPSTPGTGYVLFHHVMGSIGGSRGVWAYVQGGMGALSESIAQAARAAGASLRTSAPVERIHVDRDRVCAVVLEGGEELSADLVVSAADLARTLRWLPPACLPESFTRAVGGLDYRSPVMKLNLALDRTPEFRAKTAETTPLCGTIHVGCLALDDIEVAHQAALEGRIADRPLLELTLPSSVDSSLAPAGHHVASIFAQYAPALAPDSDAWPALRDRMADRALALLDEVAPGFSSSVVQMEVLAAPDLERIFGLTGGNIFHGAMTPDRLLSMRPAPDWARYRSPVAGLYLCGSATHPGGGVMGACGRNAAHTILDDLRGRNFPGSPRK